MSLFFGPSQYGVSIDGELPRVLFEDHEYSKAEEFAGRAQSSFLAKKSVAILRYRQGVYVGKVMEIKWA